MAQRTQHQHVEPEQREAGFTRLKSDLSELKMDLEWGICTPADNEERDDLVALIDRLLTH